MREALAIQLRRLQPNSEIYEAESLAQFAGLVAKHGAPELITTELNLPDAAGLSSVSQLKTLFPHCPLVVFTSGSAALLEEASIVAGADIFIEKTASTIDIAGALRALVSGDTELLTQMGVEKLSKRQKQLMLHLNEGLSNRDIAAKMDISEHTVKVHFWRLFKKLGVNSRTQALHYGRNNGLI